MYEERQEKIKKDILSSQSEKEVSSSDIQVMKMAQKYDIDVNAFDECWDQKIQSLISQFTKV